jgi:hypothetical protein
MLVVLYGCGTWNLTLGEKHAQSVIELGVEENIRTEEGLSDGRLEKTA